MLKVDITKGFSNFNLDISFEMTNEKLVFFGGSGSGKSSTINAITGFLKPNHGRIVFGDKIFFDSEKNIFMPTQHRKVGYVNQDLLLFKNMNAFENIAYGLRNKKQGWKDKVDEFLEKFGLLKYKKLYPHELSGGQKQRLALARVLINNPSLLLLDEPFSMLDIKLKRELKEMVLEIKENLNIPLIIVTHDLSDAFSLGDRIAFFEEGKVKAIIKSQDLTIRLSYNGDCAHQNCYCNEAVL